MKTRAEDNYDNFLGGHQLEYWVGWIFFLINIFVDKMCEISILYDHKAWW